MTLSLRLPNYFTYHLRREVKELYLATAIADVAVSAMLIFEPIYLYQTVGLSVTEVLLFFAAVYFWYTVLIPFGGKVATEFGYKHSIMVSVPAQLLYWACLFFANDSWLLLWTAPLFYGLSKTFYWPAFHAIVARFANQGQVAREFSMLSAIVQVMQILGPLAGGVIAAASGSKVLLVIAAIVYSLSLVPLVLHKEHAYKRAYQFRDTWKFFKTQARHALGYWGFGEELIALTVWPIFIYVAVESYGEAGGVVTIASAISAVLSLYIGKKVDGHPKRPLIRLGTVLTALFWFARPVLAGAQGVLASDTAARVAKNAYFIPMVTVTYERGEASDIVPYMVFFEQALSLGKLLTALAAALIFATTGSFVIVFVLAGLISLFYFLI
jgi:MFS family permease